MPARVFFMKPEEFIEQQKQTYKKIQPCYCPAIQDTVYFNADGFRHLVYDRHRPRSQKEKIYRVALIDHIEEVVKRAQKAKKEMHASPPCCIWVLEWVEIKDKKKRKQKIKIILRKQGNGRIYFWSVMKKRNSRFLFLKNIFKTKKTRP